MASAFGQRRCDRAQAWASLELDEELSQLERALLAAHLARCAGCARTVPEMRALAEVIRGAPLERPTRPLYAPAPLPAHRRTGMALRLAAAASLAVLATALGVFAGSFDRSEPSSPRPGEPEIALLPSTDDDLRDRRVLRPRSEAPADPTVPQPGRFGV